MVTKAVVVEVIDIYKARIRIPIYNQIEGAAAATPNDQLYIATISTSLGIKPAIKANDVVFVTFEDNQLQQPIIIGALAREEDTSSSNIHAQTLEVNVAASLPIDTTIGNIKGTKLKRVVDTYNELENIVNRNADLVAKLNNNINLIQELCDNLRAELDEAHIIIQEHEDRIKALEEKIK